MADEPLHKYLDRMILRNYTQRVQPEESDIRDYIEDENTGRGVPIDDSADHFLLLSFDRIRRDMLSNGTVPKANGFCGSVTIDGLNGKIESNAIQGTIPWKTMHKEQDAE